MDPLFPENVDPEDVVGVSSSTTKEDIAAAPTFFEREGSGGVRNFQ